MVDQENPPGVGRVGFEHHFEQPPGGFQLLRVVPELPGGHDLQRQVAGAANLEQRVAGHGIEGLDPAVEQDREPSKFAEVEFAVLLRQHHDGDFRGEQRQETPGQNFEQSLHAVFRFVAKAIKCVRN